MARGAASAGAAVVVGQDHGVARRRRRHARPDRLDGAGALVAQHDRQREAQRAVRGGQVGVADAHPRDPHQNLAGARRVDLNLLEREGAALFA